MPFMTELTENKEQILKTLLMDQEFVDLVSNEVGHELPALDLRYTQVFPYGWIAPTISDAKTYVCFDVDVTDTSTIAVSDIYMYFWVFTHNTLAMTNEGVRVDRIAARIDRLINGSTELGFGKVKLESCVRDSPNADYYGRVILYSVQNWNRRGRGL